MNFYKIINNTIEMAPREFVECDKRIIGFTEDFLRQHGYKPVIWTEPENGNQIDFYTEDEQYIYQHWKE